jgi:hypothetical protein
MQIYHQNRATACGNYARACEMSATGNPNLRTVLKGLEKQPGAYCYSSCRDSYSAIYYSAPASILEFGGSSVFVSTSPFLNVYSPVTNQTQVEPIPGMTAICDLYRTPSSLYVYGVNESTRVSVINRYNVDASTGLVNSTVAASLQSAAFNGSPTMTWDYFTDFAALVSRGTGECYSFDTALTTFFPCGTTVPERSVIGTTECAFTPTRDMICSSYPFGGQVSLLKPYTAASNASFPYLVSPSEGSNCRVNPAWYYQPDRGTGCVEIYGTPGSQYTVTSVPAGGGSASTVTTGRYGFGTGRSTADLGSFVNSTAFYYMTDQSGRTSAGIPSRYFNRFPRLSFVRSSKGALNMSCRWQPGRTVTWTRSSTLASNSFIPLQTYQCNQRGFAYATVPSSNYTLNTRAFYRYEAPTATTPAPEATEDTFNCTPGIEQIFDCAANDVGCPAGTTYELVTPPDPFSFSADNFQFSSDGTFKVSMITFAGGVTFSYRPVYLKKAGAIVDVVLTENTGALRNPQIYDGAGGVPWVNVPCLIYLGQSYPLYQFWLRPPDNCPEIHWHAGSFVYPLENPAVGVQDPDFPNCGFGVYRTVPVTSRQIPKSQWDAFLMAHP